MALDEMTPAEAATWRKRIGRNWVWSIHLLDPDTRKSVAQTPPYHVVWVQGIWCNAQPGFWSPPRPDVEVVEDIWDGAEWRDLGGKPYEQVLHSLLYARDRLRATPATEEVLLARWWVERIAADVEATPGVAIAVNSCLFCRHETDRFPYIFEPEGYP